jgi:hypothetical protein
MCFAAIDPYGQKWEGLAVQRMGGISNRYCTRQPFKEWGISLCLIYGLFYPIL